jgi:hypothetical protein
LWIASEVAPREARWHDGCVRLGWLHGELVDRRNDLDDVGLPPDREPPHSGARGLHAALIVSATRHGEVGLLRFHFLAETENFQQVSVPALVQDNLTNPGVGGRICLGGDVSAGLGDYGWS